MKIGDKVIINHGIAVDGCEGEIYAIGFLGEKDLCRVFVPDSNLPKKWQGWNRWAVPGSGLGEVRK